MNSVDVKLAKALVWLSSATVARHDGVVALLETEPLDQQRVVCYGNIDASEHSTERRSRWRMLPVKWSTPSDERLTLTTSAALRVTLFLLLQAVDQERARTTTRRSAAPRVSFLGDSVFAPSAQDCAALAASQEVLFTMALGPESETVGHVELLVRRQQQSEGEQEAEAAPSADGGSAFCVQWTSMDALQQELQRKAQERREQENRLVERLKAAELKAARVRELRAQAVAVLRRRRAARVIRDRVVAVCLARRLERARERDEQLARDAAKRDAVRASVRARNERRKHKLLMQWSRGSANAHDPPPAIAKHATAESVDVREWVRQQATATTAKLQSTLARLNAEHARRLAELQSGNASGDDEEDQATCASERHDRLVRAIQLVHLSD